MFFHTQSTKFQKSQKSQRSQRSSQEKVKAILDGFENVVQCQSVEYTCEWCGESRETYVFRQRGYPLGRTCLDNIDADLGQECKFQANALTREYHRKYTNWDKCYEYTTQLELEFVPWLPGWWDRKNINSETDKLTLQKVRQDVNRLIQTLGKLVNVKKEYFEEKCGITHVNMRLLDCFERRLKYYKTIIQYVGKLNKYPFYKDFQCAEWGYCHGCACKVYLKTQYERACVCVTARQKMHQVEYMDDEKQNKFVCQWCVGKAMSRAGDRYSQFIGYSTLYQKQWNEVDYFGKLYFALGHLNGQRLPVHASWYDFEKGAFRRGKILEVVDEKQLLLKIAVNDAENGHDKIQKISIKNYHENSFFIYQSPSTSWSFEFKDPNCFAKFWKETETMVDSTRAEFNDCFKEDRVMAPNRHLIAYDWMVPLVHKGSCKTTSYMHVHHMKCVYEELKKRNFFKGRIEELASIGDADNS